MEKKLKEVQYKLYEQLKPSGWADKLKMFILSDDFYNILKHLMQDSLNDKKFTPTIKHLFRAFEECPYDKLKVVIVGQDPYPKEGVADGIAFSCSKSQYPSQVQPSLRHIYKALDDEGIEHFHTYDLKDWANQGILMLNSALTTTIGTPGAHTKLWEPFMKYLFDMLSQETGLVYVFMGKIAQSWRIHISEDNNFIFTCNHPASAVYNKGGIWYSNGVFKHTTEQIKQLYNYDIKW
jgi:uracil-DNA glycosylase